MAKPLKICVCGGGKSAHVLAALAASQPDTEVNVLTVFKDEADKWSKAIEKDGMVLVYKLGDDTTREVKAKPAKVSKNPAEVVPESDLLIFTVAANTHEEYLKAIAGHFHKKMVVVGLPGLPGFEYLCKSYFGDLADQITIMSFEISPWICEIVEYGKKVEITRSAKCLNGCIVRGKAIPRKPALMSLQMLLGNEPALKQVKHFAELLFTTYTFFNPIVMYGKWKDWDGKPLDSEPLFYEDVNAATVEIMEYCSKEYQTVAHSISAKKPEVDLTAIPDIYNWLIEFYKNDIEDGTSLLRAITTNKAYKGVKHIMKKDKRKFVPDFECRYLVEDVPMGMVVVRGIAELLEVPMPTCDMIIEWAQTKLKKKYLVDGKVAGPDVKQTRAPQRFGITAIDDIILARKIEIKEFTPIVYSNETEESNTAENDDKSENAEKKETANKTEKDGSTESSDKRENAEMKESAEEDEKAGKTESAEKSDKTGKTESAEKNDKAGKTESTEKNDKAGKTESAENKTEGAEKDDKACKTESTEKNDKAAKTESAEKNDKAGKTESTKKDDKAEKKENEKADKKQSLFKSGRFTKTK